MDAITVSLDAELEGFVRAQVEGGHYASADDVVREALLLLREREDDDLLIECDPSGRPYTFEELKAEIQKGIDSGPAEPLDMERIIRECHEQYEREQRKVA